MVVGAGCVAEQEQEYERMAVLQVRSRAGSACDPRPRATISFRTGQTTRVLVALALEPWLALEPPHSPCAARCNS
jgi:hypothetical protein